MTAEEMPEFLKDRDAALTAFVMEDDLNGLWRFFDKYSKRSFGMRLMRMNLDRFLLEMYDSIKECESIPQNVQDEAIRKLDTMPYSLFKRKIERGEIPCGSSVKTGTR